ncbi:serine/threonine-protein kinase [Nocardia transvalensis]|uniref:non-specific serine/threonine protein kinase n=1 Tax=Nocardia transvalensis TaxID=37333 RepID=A0A7W9P922_9NOCA|nr:serine/threonine-protein kinase [Nocardia transvalensis]
MDAPRSRVGARFGPYELRSLLGRGGMGEVYEAYDTNKERVVALKLLSEELADDPGYRDRFRRESEAAAGLSQPHVIPIHGWGEVDGVLYLDMRLVHGDNLRTLLRRHSPLDPDRSVDLIEQIAAALDAAHTAGLVHRDVKPANILVTPADFAYLADFGIARSESDASVTLIGVGAGNYTYMAPERFDVGPVTARADIYSLACVLHECLTGTTPFPVDGVSALIRAHLSDPPPRPSLQRSDVPPALDAVIAHAMAKAPGDRYATAGEFAGAARAALGLSVGYGYSPAESGTIEAADYTDYGDADMFEEAEPIRFTEDTGQFALDPAAEDDSDRTPVEAEVSPPKTPPRFLVGSSPAAAGSGAQAAATSAALGAAAAGSKTSDTDFGPQTSAAASRQRTPEATGGPHAPGADPDAQVPGTTVRAQSPTAASAPATPASGFGAQTSKFEPQAPSDSTPIMAFDPNRTAAETMRGRLLGSSDAPRPESGASRAPAEPTTVMRVGAGAPPAESGPGGTGPESAGPGSDPNSFQPFGPEGPTIPARFPPRGPASEPTGGDDTPPTGQPVSATRPGAEAPTGPVPSPEDPAAARGGRTENAAPKPAREYTTTGSLRIIPPADPDEERDTTGHLPVIRPSDPTVVRPDEFRFDPPAEAHRSHEPHTELLAPGLVNDPEQTRSDYAGREGAYGYPVSNEPADAGYEKPTGYGKSGGYATSDRHGEPSGYGESDHYAESRGHRESDPHAEPRAYSASSEYEEPRAYGEPDSSAETHAYSASSEYEEPRAYGEPDSSAETHAYSASSEYEQSRGYGEPDGAAETHAYSRSDGYQAGYRGADRYGESREYGDDSAAETRAYSASDGYEESDGYGRPRAYDDVRGYNKPNGYDQPGGYDEPTGYDEPGGYDQPRGYGEYEDSDEYGRARGYDADSDEYGYAFGAPAEYDAEPTDYEERSRKRSIVWPIVLGVLVVAVAAVAITLGLHVLSKPVGTSPTVASGPPTNGAPATSGPPARSSASSTAPTTTPTGIPAGATECQGATASQGKYGKAATGTSVTSCAFAEAVREAYAQEAESGSSTPSSVVAVSPVTGRSYTMNCSASGRIVTCTGGENAVVYVY